VHRRAHRTLCILFLAATALAYPVSSAAAPHRGAWYIALHALLTVLMLGAWRAAHLLDATGQADPADPADRAPRHLTQRLGTVFRWTLMTGVLARLMLVGVAPFTSTDIERYLWDGRVLLAGEDPYRLSPDAPALRELHASWPTPAEHATYPTIYPPAAITLFAVAARTGPALALTSWKLIVAAASILTVWIVAVMLRDRERSEHLALIALSPLHILEGGVGGHIDIVATLPVAAALLLHGRRRPGLSGVALGAGALVKLLPAVAVLPLAYAVRGRATTRVLIGAGAVLGLGYATAFAFGLRPVGSLFVFFERWRFGAPAFAALNALSSPALAASVLCALAVVGWAAAITLARAGRPIAGTQLAFALPLLASPVVFPWYLSVLTPGLALAPSATLLAWQTAHPLTYEVLDGYARTGVWHAATWPLWGIGAAWVIGALIDRALIRRVG
jgi:alpha-1,6-mannosyltransferase